MTRIPFKPRISVDARIALARCHQRGGSLPGVQYGTGFFGSLLSGLKKVVLPAIKAIGKAALPMAQEAITAGLSARAAETTAEKGRPDSDSEKEPHRRRQSRGIGCSGQTLLNTQSLTFRHRRHHKNAKMNIFDVSDGSVVIPHAIGFDSDGNLVLVERVVHTTGKYKDNVADIN